MSDENPQDLVSQALEEINPFQHVIVRGSGSDTGSNVRVLPLTDVLARLSVMQRDITSDLLWERYADPHEVGFISSPRDIDNINTDALLQTAFGDIEDVRSEATKHVDIPITALDEAYPNTGIPTLNYTISSQMISFSLQKPPKLTRTTRLYIDTARSYVVDSLSRLDEINWGDFQRIRNQELSPIEQLKKIREDVEYLSDLDIRSVKKIKDSAGEELTYSDTEEVEEVVIVAEYDREQLDPSEVGEDLGEKAHQLTLRFNYKGDRVWCEAEILPADPIREIEDLGYRVERGHYWNASSDRADKWYFYKTDTLPYNRSREGMGCDDLYSAASHVKALVVEEEERKQNRSRGYDHGL